MPIPIKRKFICKNCNKKVVKVIGDIITPLDFLCPYCKGRLEPYSIKNIFK